MQTYVSLCQTRLPTTHSAGSLLETNSPGRHVNLHSVRELKIRSRFLSALPGLPLLGRHHLPRPAPEGLCVPSAPLHCQVRHHISSALGNNLFHIASPCFGLHYVWQPLIFSTVRCSSIPHPVHSSTFITTVLHPSIAGLLSS